MIPAQRRPSEAGFVRLGEMLLKRASVPGVDQALGGQGFTKPDLFPNANAVPKIQRALVFQEEGTIRRSTLPVTHDVALESSAVMVEQQARHLALTLGGSDGLRNLAFYRKVARTVPRHIVLDAFGRAKDAQHIRKSRAHLFAYLVRPHLNR